MIIFIYNNIEKMKRDECLKMKNIILLLKFISVLRKYIRISAFAYALFIEFIKPEDMIFRLSAIA